MSAAACDFCGVCVAVCPAGAIELKESSVRVLDELCVGCGDCAVMCPLGVPVREEAE
ncbi:4Fe-4S binding protein [bacterium]|nr:4Fe-4S binding protein [bacterium]